MQQTFTIRDLKESQFSQALPLVRVTWPAVDLETWQAFARAFADDVQQPGSNVVGLFDVVEALCGVFVYRLDHDLIEGRVLSVPLFTAVDVANSLEPIRALLGAVEARAQGAGCAGVHIALLNEQSEMSARLHMLGLSRAAILHGMKLGTAWKN